MLSELARVDQLSMMSVDHTEVAQAVEHHTFDSPGATFNNARQLFICSDKFVSSGSPSKRPTLFWCQWYTNGIRCTMDQLERLRCEMSVQLQQQSSIDDPWTCLELFQVLQRLPVVFSSVT
jgi:hypothetical protein